MPTPSAKSNRLGAKIGFAVAAAIALVLALAFWLRPVASVVLVKRGVAVDARPGSVTVEAGYELDLTSAIGGRIVRSEIDEGRPFKKGEFMAQLDAGDLQLELERTEADYETLKSRLAVGSQLALEFESAEADMARSEQNYKLGFLAKAEVERQRRSLEEMRQRLALEKVDNQSQLKALENQIKSERRQIAKMTIVAPFDGVVSAVQARPGALIGTDAPIATFVATDRRVLAHISEEDFSGIEVGQSASVRFLSYGDQVYPAKVARILPTADPATQRYTVYLDVDIPLDRLVPDLTGEVSIVVGRHENALIVPRRALFGNRLYVVKGGRVRLRTVELGYVGLNEGEVLSGVDEGDAVIAEDLDRFSNGDHVRTEVLLR